MLYSVVGLYGNGVDVVLLFGVSDNCLVDDITKGKKVRKRVQYV